MFNSESLHNIIGELKTPFYLYSRDVVLQNLNYFSRCAADFLENFSVHYAMKANSNIEILKTLATKNCGVDIVSIGEYKIAKQAGIPSNKIIFSGIGKTEEEIEYIVKDSKSCIKSFNVESLDELELIQEISKKHQVITPIAFRLNPDVNADTHRHISTGGAAHKFGLSFDQIEMALAQSYQNLKLVGLSIHIGSQLKNFEATKHAIEQMLELINKNNIDKLDFLDMGGGLGIYYGPSDDNLISPAQYFKQIHKSISKQFSGKNIPEIVFEPGRFITGNAGLLISKVIRVKENVSKTFIILDSGMNELIRPSLYDAYHEIHPLDKASDEKSTIYDFVGPICETGDYFAKDRPSFPIKKGDLVAIGNCGSYARVMASTYNARNIPNEYFLEDLIVS